MSRSLSYLRQSLLGILFVASLSFGAATALATPEQRARMPRCNTVEVEPSEVCTAWCGERGGYCDRITGLCVCYPPT